MADVAFLEALQEVIRDHPDGISAWRAFRASGLDHGRLEGRNAGDREQTFMAIYSRYREYPAQAVLDLRLERVKELYSDVTRMFLSTPGVSELDIEGYLRHTQGLDHPGGLERALVALSVRGQDVTELRTRAETLFPPQKLLDSGSEGGGPENAS